MANKAIRIHVRVFVKGQYPVATMLNNARSLLKTASVDIDERSNLDVKGKPQMHDLTFKDVGEMAAIKAREGITDPKEIVVFLVNSTDPPFSGVSAVAGDPPWVIVTTLASAWTLAHEIGHLFRLLHVVDTDRLMTDAGTDSITNPPPDLDSGELGTIKKSSLLF